MIEDLELNRKASIFNRQIKKAPPTWWSFCTLTENRTPVLGLKGLRPSPLDDEGKRMEFYHLGRFGSRDF